MIRKAFIGSVAFFCLVLCQLQIKGQASSAGNEPVEQGRRSFAMIMGISTYKYIRPLSFADSDAELIRDYLKSPGGGNIPDSNIYFLKNEEAKAANILVKGLAWLRAKAPKKGDRFYLYMAGHGDAINQDEYFYLAYDCNPAGDKNNYLITGTVQLYNLKVRIADLSRKGVEVIFIMDACRTNELPGGGEGQEMLTNAISEKNSGEILMLATGAGQESLEDANIGTGHGLFTYYLVDGLSGLADAGGNSDNKITLKELKTHVGKTVPVVAQERYKKKQDPYLCCEEDEEKVIATVDTAFLRKWILSKQLRGELSESEAQYASRTFKTRGFFEREDTTILEYYNSFNKALKDYNLSGHGNSAESYYLKLNTIAPNSSYTLDAKLSLAAEFINFAQSKVNQYLSGRDVSAVQRIRSQFDAEEKTIEIGSSLDRMEKVARQDFSEVGQMVEKAIALLSSEEDDSYTRSLQAMNFFFKANGYYEKKGEKRIDLRQAIEYAYNAYRNDPKAAYILNTLASLHLDNNKPDSTVFFGKKALQAAPKWRYPYMNVANAFNQLNEYDSARAYYWQAIQVAPNAADGYVDLGYFFFQHRKLDSAKVYYQKALSIEPGNVFANNNMGWLLKEERQFPLALQFFRKSLVSDPQFFNAYNGISRVFSDMRLFDSARIYYEKAKENYPDKLITNNYLGQFYQEMNQMDSAKVYYRQAAVFDPSYDAPFINLGRLFAQARQYDSAKYYYFKALELNNRNFRGYNQLGLMFTQMKEYDSAHHYLREAIAINPENTIVLNNIGLAYSEQKIPDSAAVYFRKVIEIQPDNPYAFNNLGVVFFDLKKYDSAQFYYKQALSLKSNLASSLINLGLISYNLKQYDEAKFYLKKVVEPHPENTLALDYLEMVFKKEFQYDSAIYYYQRAVKANVISSFVYNNLGRLYFDMEKYDSAMKYYYKSIELKDNNASGYNNLGFVYYRLNNLDSSAAYYRLGLSKEPDNYFSNYYIGLVYYDMAKYELALEHIKKAITINPRNNAPYYYLACTYGSLKKHEEALIYLGQALERGYNSYEYIIVEPGLDGVRRMVGYRDLMKKYFPKKYKPEDNQE